jgi:DNA-binding MarR family transcriptional regulator
MDPTCTCYALRKLARTVTRLYDQHLAAVGIKATQFALLRHVQHEALPITHLATLMGMERTTLTRNLRPLADAGWVAQAAGKDARVRVITITPEGQAKIREAKAAWRTAQAELEQALGDEGTKSLHAEIGFAMARIAPLLQQ